MKRLFACFICIITMLIISFNINGYAFSYSRTITDSKLKGITILSSNTFDVDSITKHGFNIVFLNADNIRNAKSPYNTSYSALRQLSNNIAKLEKANIDYIICFTSGPGYSSDGKISTIFKNRTEMIYFSKMAKEVIGRFKTHSNFKGASINLGTSETGSDKFYSTQNNIINNVRSTYRDLPFVYNLHMAAFEENFKNLPVVKLPNIILNMTIYLKGLTYPGYGAGFKTSCTLNKNAILDDLEKFKDYQSSNKAKALITLKTPWVKNSEVLLQDLFEIYRILKFDFNLAYGNSSDIYDLRNNSSVLKVLDRQNR